MDSHQRQMLPQEEISILEFYDSDQVLQENKSSQNIKKLQIKIEYFEESHDNKEFHHLIEQFKDIRQLEIIILQFDLFLTSTYSECIQTLLNYFNPLQNLEELVIEIKNDNGDRSDFLELCDFFIQNKKLKKLELKLLYANKSMQIQYLRNKEQQNPSLVINNSYSCLSNNYWNVCHNKLTFLQELTINLFASSSQQYKMFGEFLKNQSTLKFLSITIKNQEKIPNEEQGDLVSHLHCCKELQHLYLDINFKICNEFVAALGQNLQQIDQLRKIYLLLNQENENEDENRFIELSKGIQNQSQLDTLEASVTPHPNWDCLNYLQFLQNLNLYSPQASFCSNNPSLQDITYGIGYYFRTTEAHRTNIINLGISLQKLINLNTLRILFPSNMDVSNQGIAEIYCSFQKMPNLQKLQMKYQTSDELYDSNMFFGDNLKHCELLQEFDVVYKNNTNINEESLTLFGETLLHLTKLEKIKIEINKIAQEGQLTLFYYLNQVVEQNFSDQYTIQYKCEMQKSNESNCVLDYQRNCVKKRILRFQIVGDQRFEVNTQYLKESFSSIQNVQYVSLIITNLQTINVKTVQIIYQSLQELTECKSLYYCINNSESPLNDDHHNFSISKYQNLIHLYLNFNKNIAKQNGIKHFLDSLQNQKQLKSLGITIQSDFQLDANFYTCISGVIQEMNHLNRLAIIVLSRSPEQESDFQTLIKTILNLKNIFHLILSIVEFNIELNRVVLKESLKSLNFIKDFQYFFGYDFKEKMKIKYHILKYMSRLVNVKKSLSTSDKFKGIEHQFI